jgi:hypothetical protein
MCLVTLLCFGLQVVGAVAAVAKQLGHAAPSQVQFGNAAVLWTAILELAALGAALWIGSIRGWSLAKFGLRISWRDTGAGVVLFAGVLLASALIEAALRILHLEKAPVRIVGMTLPFALLFSLINPVFEETLESGYFIHALQHFGMWPAILASTLFTCFLHAYLGLQGAAGILLTRVIFGLVYWRWRQLWPLFVAHSLLDLLGLANPSPNL